MKKKLFLLILLIISFTLSAYGCSKKNNYYTEKYRPQYHFTPEKNWMNDPNGMVYYEGKYHLFYQYHPESSIWGPMNWGHAVSTDMVTWTHLPIALKPDDLGTIFSGSAVVDSNDTSGLFNGGSGLVALYTNDKDGLQQQSMAYSTDGENFNKYTNNPVIKNPGTKNFRDPKVIWYEPTKRWIMLVSRGYRIEFYDSSDLKTWNYISNFGEHDGSHEGVWECPELMELPVDGNSDNKKWVLKVDIGDHAIGGGSGAQYFVGNFDGSKFINDNTPNTTLWVDYGTDFYAAQSWSNAKDTDGSYYWLGWMNNWKYAQAIPTEIWRGADTIPRKVSLKSFPDGLRLVQSPVSQLESLRNDPMKFDNVEIEPGKNILKKFSGDSYEIEAEFELGTAQKFGFNLRKSDSEQTTVFYQTKDSKIYVDRTHSGDVSFNPSFAQLSKAELKPVNNKIKMHIFVDASSVEVFANDGEKVMTNLIFPNEKSKGLELFSEGGNVKLSNLKIYKLNSSWKK